MALVAIPLMGTWSLSILFGDFLIYIQGEDMTRRAILNLEIIGPGSLDRQAPALSASRALAVDLVRLTDAACPSEAHGSESIDQICQCRAKTSQWRTTWATRIQEALGLHEVPVAEDSDEDIPTFDDDDTDPA